MLTLTATAQIPRADTLQLLVFPEREIRMLAAPLLCKSNLRAPVTQTQRLLSWESTEGNEIVPTEKPGWRPPCRDAGDSLLLSRKGSCSSPCVHDTPLPEVRAWDLPCTAPHAEQAAGILLQPFLCPSTLHTQHNATPHRRPFPVRGWKMNTKEVMTRGDTSL